MILRSLLAATMLAGSAPFALAGDTTERRITDALIWVGESARVARPVLEDADRRAIAAFERNASLRVDGALEPAELQFLMRMAETERRREGYAMWTDARTGVRIGLPREWLAPARETADGTRWASPDRAIIVETFASSEDSISTLDAIERVKGNRRVSYDAGGADWFVLSGTEAGGARVFYVRGTMHDGEVRGFRASYERALAWRLSRVVTAMSSDFQPFPGADGRNGDMVTSLTPVSPDFTGLPAAGPEPEARPERRFAGLAGEGEVENDMPTLADDRSPDEDVVMADAAVEAFETTPSWDRGLQLGMGTKTRPTVNPGVEKVAAVRFPAVDDSYVGVPAVVRISDEPPVMAAEAVLPPAPDWLDGLGIDPAELASLSQPQSDIAAPIRVAFGSELAMDGLDPAEALSLRELASVLGIEPVRESSDVPFGLATAIGGLDPMAEWEPTVLIAVLGVAADAARPLQLSSDTNEQNRPAQSLVTRIRSAIATTAVAVEDIGESGLVLPRDHPGIDMLPTASVRVSSAPLNLQNGRAVDGKTKQKPVEITNTTETLSILGMVTTEGRSCPTLRSADGTLYSLEGAPQTAKPGAVLRIEATTAETSACEVGRAVAVQSVEIVAR